MSIVGIDLSTHNVDLVKLDEDSDRAEWVRVPLVGENAIDRARSYLTGKSALYRFAGKGLGRRCYGSFWDDVILCALEDPAGRGDTRKIARVQGVVIATIPARVQVWTLQPAEWRRHCGLKGNASKGAVAAWVEGRRFRAISHWIDGRLYYDEPEIPDWPQDACDAYAIAYAARAINASAASVAEGNQTQEEAA